MQVNLKAHTALQLAPVEPYFRWSYQTASREATSCSVNSLGSLGGPTIMHDGAWRRQASHCKWKWHPPQFLGAMNWSTHAPTIYGTIHPHLAAPPYGALSPTTYPSLQVSTAFSAFTLQLHHTSDHSLQVQGANGHTSKPPPPIDHCK